MRWVRSNQLNSAQPISRESRSGPDHGAGYPASGRVLLSVILSLFSIGTAPWVFSCFFRFVWTGYDSPSWPTVPGRIIQSELSHSSGKYGGYSPKLSYTYAVGGGRHVCENLYAPGVSSMCKNPDEPEDILWKFPVGAEVPVYYSREDPKVACLIPGLRATHFVFAVIFLAWVIVPPAILIRDLRKIRAAK